MELLKHIASSIGVLCAMLVVPVAKAQHIEEYNRSSLYTITLLHSEDRMYNEIFLTALDMPVPDRYNDNSLSLRVVGAPNAKGKMNYSPEKMSAEIAKFLNENHIGRRMVARWFDRDKNTGAFSTATLEQRGHYNLSALDLQRAQWTIDGRMYIEDADVELIPQTFVIVNDITYIDKEKNAQIASSILSALGSAAGSIGNGLSNSVAGAGSIGSLAELTLNAGADISDLIAGFTVDIRSYLFQLEWNEEIANKFYLDYFYTDTIDLVKKAAFEADETSFRMKYLGTYNARSAKTSPRGLYEPAQVFRKVLTRATDKNIVELQKQYPVFKVTTVITGINDQNEAMLSIGLKEGVNPKSKYEVLQRELKNGKLKYTRVATLTPVAGKIWDNRYMAAEEEAENAQLGFTTFRINSANADLLPGMLVREMR